MAKRTRDLPLKLMSVVDRQQICEGEVKARKARDIPLYLLPVVGRQQIWEGRVGWILKGQKGQGYFPLPAAGGWETADLRRASWLDSQRPATPEYAPILAIPKFRLSFFSHAQSVVAISKRNANFHYKLVPLQIRCCYCSSPFTIL